uniref:reverse transcriptase domain-containing protein n=1 Tax=Janthinobacterium sp. TaxID=1871054 RepID=UPI00293D8CF2
MSNDQSHLIGRPEEIKVNIKGVGGSGTATLRGTVAWRITNDKGQIQELRIPNTYYDKRAPYCLLSPQHMAQEARAESTSRDGTYCITRSDTVELHWARNTQKKTVMIDRATNIPLMRSAPGYKRFNNFYTEIASEVTDITSMVATDAASGDPGLVTDYDSDADGESEAEEESIGDSGKPSSESGDANNQEEQSPGRRHPDLPDSVFVSAEAHPGTREQIQREEDEDVQAMTPQAEMLAWHYRLGHLPFERIKRLAERGDLPTKLATCKVPKCASCLYGKPTRRAWRSKLPKNKVSRLPAVTSPGAVVSIDQMISLTPGLIAQMRGFVTRKRYTTVTVFVDHFSGLSFVHLQQSTTAFETVIAKRTFERYAAKFNVKVRHYHADNGIFAEAEFAKAVKEDGQTISYCGVNAHHQNGRAEKKIRDLQDLARTMILHAQQRWPSAVTANLWPYAVRMANDVSNDTPSIKGGVAPIELFAQVAVSPRVKHSHTFGSPVYVLDTALQTAGKRIPKWARRARVGLYLGTSPRHSRKVALVLSLRTGHVSPQFHVVFDDLFETLRASAGNVLPESNWQDATGFATKITHKDTQTRTVQESAGNIPDTEIPEVEWANHGTQMNIQPAVNDPAEDTDGQANTGERSREDSGNETIAESVQIMENERQFNAQLPATNPTRAARPTTRTEDGTARTLVTTRSGRVSKPTTRWEESQQQQKEKLVALHVSWEVYHDGGYQIAEAMEDPIAFVASANPDIMYLEQAMKEPDSEQFEKAMLDEVRAHTDNKHWVVRRRADLPKRTKVLPAVWAMRRKRRITTGLPYKWKARLNLHGGKQEYGVNYWETYAPVIAWTTIRLFLILAYMNRWGTRQVDFVLAYPQADIECTMFM